MSIENENKIDNEMVEKNLFGPRVTPQTISDAIVSGAYHRLPNTNITVCVLTLRNGYTVTGESACVSAENFNEEIGNKIAYENARAKIWQLEGYLLADDIYRAELDKKRDYRDRVREEYRQLFTKVEKLSAFFGTPQYEALEGTPKALLERQIGAMREYLNTLAERISLF